MNILIVEPSEIHESAVKLLKDAGHVIFNNASEVGKTQIDALFIRTYTQVSRKYLDAFPILKYILKAGVGLDNIDTEECKKRNIQVINAPGANANAVAEYVIMTMFMLGRKIQKQSNQIYENNWRSKEHMGNEIKGKVIGIVGCGAIGKLLAKKLDTFEVGSIIGYDPFVDEQTLHDAGIQKRLIEDVFSKADFITLHLPPMPKTLGLVDKKLLSLMKKKSFLINSARGEIVNEKDLLELLQKGQIAGAALDVFANEPHINSHFLELQNVILTPHIGGYTYEADRQIAYDAASRFLALHRP